MPRMFDALEIPSGTTQEQQLSLISWLHNNDQAKVISWHPVPVYVNNYIKGAFISGPRDANDSPPRTFKDFARYANMGLQLGPIAADWHQLLKAHELHVPKKVADQTGWMNSYACLIMGEFRELHVSLHAFGAHAVISLDDFKHRPLENRSLILDLKRPGGAPLIEGIHVIGERNIVRKVERYLRWMIRTNQPFDSAHWEQLFNEFKFGHGRKDVSILVAIDTGDIVDVVYQSLVTPEYLGNWSYQHRLTMLDPGFKYPSMIGLIRKPVVFDRWQRLNEILKRTH